MATFTMELNEVLEFTTDIGLDTYPIHPPLLAVDPEFRKHLNDKIIEHYINQEIGTETIGMFRLAVRRRLNEVMPYINQHYAASMIAIDPLLTVDVQNIQATAGNATATSASDTTSNSTSKTRLVQSDTPQTMLQADGEYASGAADTISDSDATANSGDESSTVQSGSVDGTVKGFQGSAAMMIMQYRQSFVNVDMMVIDALSDCFMSVWSNGDEFTTGGNFYGGIRIGFGLRFF